jgi:uncharacterized membrane protein (DUF4010 family)
MHNGISETFHGLFDSFWFLFISIMTIGYGEYSPNIMWSKISLVVATFIGLALNSVFVICTERVLMLDDVELEAYVFIMRCRLIEEQRTQLVRYGQANFRHK